jgi:hypothetical protein
MKDHHVNEWHIVARLSFGHGDGHSLICPAISFFEHLSNHVHQRNLDRDIIR